MKVCPQCNKTYSDETLNFCLDDGSVLTQPQNTTSNEPAETVMMSPPTPTVSNEMFGTQQTAGNFNQTPRYQSPSAGSSSKTWLWVVGIIFVVIFLCGGGFIGLALIIPTENEEFVPKNTNISTGENKNANKDKNVKDTRKLVESINFTKWNIKENEYIKSEFKNGELILTSKDKFYYVILTKNLKTYNASTSLTLRNTTGEKANYGYGLIIHSDPKKVITKDYAFVIRSDTRQYRVVRHTNKRESNIIPWTRSSAINSGTAANTLEVRVNDKDMNFYINGTFVKNVKDFTGYQDGVAGIYTSDDVPIAFQKLEIRE